VLKVKQRVSARFLVACSFIHSIHRTQMVITDAKETLRMAVMMTTGKKESKGANE
jgi:hypothetical protein